MQDSSRSRNAVGPERIVRELRSLRERQDAELRKLIRRSARAGIRSQDIADAIGISRATLWRRYGLELHRGERRGASVGSGAS